MLPYRHTCAILVRGTQGNTDMTTDAVAHQAFVDAVAEAGLDIAADGVLESSDISELLETGSVTVTIGERSFILSLGVVDLADPRN